MSLHPQIQAVLDTAAASGQPAPADMPVAEGRLAFIERAASANLPKAEIAEVVDRTIYAPGGSIPIRLFRPSGAAETGLPVVVFFHGGGWRLGNLDTHDPQCRALAEGAGCLVVAVDYRLAPEHRFPAAVDDAWAVVQWVGANAVSIGADPARIAVAGDSAGGTLATVVAQLAREAGGPPLARQIMVYPVLDARTDTASYARYAEGFNLTRAAMVQIFELYLEKPEDAADLRASPLRAADLSGLPPALIIAASHDPLVDEGVAYAKQLRDAGVAVDYHAFEGYVHGFFGWGAVVDGAGEAIDLCTAALRSAFAGR